MRTAIPGCSSFRRRSLGQVRSSADGCGRLGFHDPFLNGIEESYAVVPERHRAKTDRDLDAVTELPVKYRLFPRANATEKVFRETFRGRGFDPVGTRAVSLPRVGVLSLALHPGTREAQFSDAVFEEAGEGGSGSITMAPSRRCVPPVNRATPASSFSS